jgi:hypothetical protein
LAGVVVVPMNRVTSASAGAAPSNDIHAPIVKARNPVLIDTFSLLYAS